ncbi:hypothetical protein [Natrinema salinisoli]|uniref:hypothetical protein n=1 Tax=Natrinema salinisoli TaxID=2878535 RepID=UPI0031BB03CA
MAQTRCFVAVPSDERDENESELGPLVPAHGVAEEASENAVDWIVRWRLVLSTDADLSNVDPADVIAEIVDTIEPPSADTSYAFDSPAASDGGTGSLE